MVTEARSARSAHRIGVSQVGVMASARQGTSADAMQGGSARWSRIVCALSRVQLPSSTDRDIGRSPLHDVIDRTPTVFFWASDFPRPDHGKDYMDELAELAASLSE